MKRVGVTPLDLTMPHVTSEQAIVTVNLGLEETNVTNVLKTIMASLQKDANVTNFDSFDSLKTTKVAHKILKFDPEFQYITAVQVKIENC